MHRRWLDAYTPRGRQICHVLRNRHANNAVLTNFSLPDSWTLSPRPCDVQVPVYAMPFQRARMVVMLWEAQARGSCMHPTCHTC